MQFQLSHNFISISVNRYMNHHQSFNLEKTLNSMVKNKMEEMMKHNMSWIDVQFLKESLDTLFECRRTLMYTYAFAHYLKKNNHSTMFEVIVIFHNQRIYSILFISCKNLVIQRTFKKFTLKRCLLCLIVKPKA